jgi:hypothetical protein
LSREKRQTVIDARDSITTHTHTPLTHTHYHTHTITHTHDHAHTLSHTHTHTYAQYASCFVAPPKSQTRPVPSVARAARDQLSLAPKAVLTIQIPDPNVYFSNRVAP